MATQNFPQQDSQRTVGQPSGQNLASLPQDNTYGNAKNEVGDVIQKLVNRLIEKSSSLQGMIDELSKTNQRIPGEDNLDLIWNLDRIEHLIDNICDIRFVSSREAKLDKIVSWERGSDGSKKINLSQPNSFALSHVTGKMYIADTNNKRISCFSDNGFNMRVKYFTESPTPNPERITFDQQNNLIWVYATGVCNASFIAISPDDFREKPAIEAPNKVRSFAIDRQTGKPTFYCYDSGSNCISYAGIDPAAVVPYTLDEIHLESEYLEETERDVEIERLDDKIFVLYQDCRKCRIISFNLQGGQLSCYLPCNSYTRIECFSIISSNTFLLGVVGDVPLIHPPQTSILSPTKKEFSVKACLVSFEGQIRDQLSWPVKPAINFNTNEMRCSQMILHGGKLFCLLKCCDNNLLVFSPI